MINTDDREVFLEESHFDISKARNLKTFKNNKEKKRNDKLIIAVACLLVSWILIIIVSVRETNDEDALPISPELEKIYMTLLDFSKAPDFTYYGSEGADF